MPLIEYVTENIQTILGFIEAFVGGLFGLYLILIILRWRESHTVKKLLIEIRDELKNMNKKPKQKKK